MKINILSGIISLALSALLTFGIFSLGNFEMFNLNTIGAAVCFAVTLVPLFSLRFEDSRLTTNIKILSGIFAFALIISNSLFAVFHFSNAPYIIVNGIFLLIYLLIANGLYRANQ